MKQCSICKVPQDESNFNKNRTRKDGLGTVCKECSKKRSKKYYQENQEKQKAVVVKRNKEYRKRLQTIVLKEFEKGCKDCGNMDVRVLEFDHLPEYEKLFDISRIISSSMSEKILKEEIVKCDVVCANCHRIRTTERSTSYRKDINSSLAF